MSSNKTDDHLFFISHLYPEELNTQFQMSPQQVGNEKKSRRRRKKVNGEGNDAAMRKRKLSEEQVNLLESSFENEQKLDSERKERLASELGLDPRQVAVWFQNRRTRWKSKKLEEEYTKLKSLHDNVVLQKCDLQSEVLRMKEQLSEAEHEVRRLLERVEVGSSHSPSSSLSIDAMGIPFMERYEYEMNSLQNVLYIPDNLWGQSM